jgi:dipeptidyl aminopeptidase/acylaminoacyl peptidase
VAVSKDDTPTLLIAGDKDDLVPIKHSEDIQKAFEEKGVPSRLFVVKGAGHGFAGNDLKKSIDEMVKFFEEKLAKARN